MIFLRLNYKQLDINRIKNKFENQEIIGYKTLIISFIDNY